MLTIEIPKSNRRKSEEDALASFILSEIKEKGECVYFHYGVGWGNNWPHCWAKNTGSDAKDRHQISELAHDNVIRAFIDKGYSVEYRSEIAAGRYVIIRRIATMVMKTKTSKVTFLLRSKNLQKALSIFPTFHINVHQRRMQDFTGYQ